MDDLISRQELANLLVVAQDEDFITLEEYDKFWDLVSRVPSADRPKGRWEHQELAPTNWTFCSVCGRQRSKKYKWYYCPNCGADMRGEQDE